MTDEEDIIYCAYCRRNSARLLVLESKFGKKTVAYICGECLKKAFSQKSVSRSEDNPEGVIDYCLIDSPYIKFLVAQPVEELLVPSWLRGFFEGEKE